MANKNFEIKNGLTVAGTERITSAGVITGTTATQSASDNTTKLASTAYVTTALANLSDSAPSTLNTLNELAAALGDDANYATTTTNAIAAKLPLAGGTVTGVTTFTGGDGVVLETSSDTFLQLKTTGSGSNYIEFKDSGGAAGNIRYNHSTNLLSVKTNGTDNRLVIDASGNVGIGTGSNVDEMLHIEKSSGTTLVKTEVAANSVVGLEIKKTGSTTSNWRIVDGQTVNGNLEIYDVTDSRSVMIFDGDGDIGMGVTPATHAKLTLGGTATSYSSVLAFDNNTTGGATFFMLASDNTWNAGGNKFFMGHGQASSAAVDITIDADGKVGIGTTAPGSNHTKANNLVVGSGSAGGMAVFNGTAEGWYAFSRANANNSDAYDGGMSYTDRVLRFHTNAGATRLKIDGSGDTEIYGHLSFEDNKLLMFGGGQDARLYFDASSNALFITAANGTANTVNITTNNFQIGGATPLISGTANESVVINQDGASNVDFRVESDNEAHNFFCDASSEIIHFGEGTNSDTVSVIPAGTLAGRRHGYHGGNKQHAGQTFKYCEGTSWTDAIKIDWHNVSWGAVCMRITGMYYYTASQNFSIVIGFQGYGEVGSSSYGSTSVSYDATSSGAMNWTSALQLSQSATGETLIKQRAGDSTGDVIYRYEWQCYARSNQPILIIEQ